jgi:hypothetical protein
MTPDMPSPDAIREACARRSWDDDVDDESRILLEHAADVIRELQSRVVLVAHFNEQAEAVNQRLTEYVWSLSRQKGGAT